MASPTVGVLGSMGAFAAVPAVGWIATVGAAVLDAYVVGPRLAGKGKQQSLAPRLLDSPVGSNEPGAPRISAYGSRVRVPTHILWQASKVREPSTSNSKAGTNIPQRRVYFDALVALNDRVTESLVQLVGNGKLILTKSRNLVDIRTSEMTVSIASGRVVLTMGSTEDPDFALKFAVDDVVTLSGFIVASGTDINVGFWKVYSVTGHNSSPSTITLSRYSGQNIVATSAAAGTLFSPAVIARADDRVFCEGGAEVQETNPQSNETWITITVGSHLNPNDVFNPDERLDLSAFTYLGVPLGTIRHNGTGRTTDTVLWIKAPPGITNTTGGPIALVGGSSTDAAQIRSLENPRFAITVFPAAFDPDAYFHDGSEDQEPDALLEAAKGTGNAPAYRGVACQGLDDFFATLFGDQLPYSLEALIDVDPLMTWSDALATIISERANIPRTAINVDGVTSRPFLGAYFRGPVPVATSLQPLTLAGQIVGQERDGTICLFQIENADVVAIDNSADIAHFGTRPEGAEPEEKWTIDDGAVEDLPTSVGIRHQDPDNGYADGYQHFGLRNPEGVDHQNEQEIDLSNVVLTRKDAANLAATILRRAWVNRRTFRFVLPPSYLYLLENDILTWFDDEGETQVARIIQRDIGSDFRVHVTAIREDLDIASDNVGVAESAAGNAPRRTTAAASIDVVLVDAPAVRQDELAGPALRVAVADAGGTWAGSAIYESTDGTTFNQVAIVADRAVIGTLESGMAAGTAAETYGSAAITEDGDIHEVTFSDYGVEQVEECTQAEAIAGKNWCAIVDINGEVEIAAFTTVTDLGDNVLELGGWLRGLRGTSPSAKTGGARLVMLTGPGALGVHWLQHPGALTPKALAYKVVPAGLSVDDVEPVSIVSQWRNVLPLPVRSVTKTIGANPYPVRFEVAANWTRRILPVGDQGPHSVDEPVEAYRFTVYDPTGTIQRATFDVSADRTGSGTLRDRYIDIEAADLTTYGYTPSGSETFWVDVQQVGEYGVGPSIKQEL